MVLCEEQTKGCSEHPCFGANIVIILKSFHMAFFLLWSAKRDVTQNVQAAIFHKIKINRINGFLIVNE